MNKKQMAIAKTERDAAKALKAADTEPTDAPQPVQQEAPQPSTLGDNITSMAELIYNIKRTFRLQEQTILRVIDMNLAVQERAQEAARYNNRPQPQPAFDENLPIPSSDAELAAMLGIGQPAAPDETIVEGEFTEVTETPETTEETNAG